MGRVEALQVARADVVSGQMDGYQGDRGEGVIRRVELVKERGFPGAGCCGQCQHERTGRRECFEGGSDRGGRMRGKRGAQRAAGGKGQRGRPAASTGDEGGDGLWRDLA